MFLQDKLSTEVCISLQWSQGHQVLLPIRKFSSSSSLFPLILLVLTLPSSVISGSKLNGLSVPISPSVSLVDELALEYEAQLNRVLLMLIKNFKIIL